MGLSGVLVKGFALGGLGFRVWGLGFRVWGLGFGVKGLGFSRVSLIEIYGEQNGFHIIVP